MVQYSSSTVSFLAISPLVPFLMSRCASIVHLSAKTIIQRVGTEVKFLYSRVFNNTSDHPPFPLSFIKLRTGLAGKGGN